MSLAHKRARPHTHQANLMFSKIVHKPLRMVKMVVLALELPWFCKTLAKCFDNGQLWHRNWQHVSRTAEEAIAISPPIFHLFGRRESSLRHTVICARCAHCILQSFAPPSRFQYAATIVIWVLSQGSKQGRRIKQQHAREKRNQRNHRNKKIMRMVDMSDRAVLYPRGLHKFAATVARRRVICIPSWS